PHGEPIPRDVVVNRYWETTRPAPGSGGLVTDHRGHVERWLGFVFHTLKEYEPEAVEIRTFPEGQAGVGMPVNSMLTLRELKLFSACARAIQLAGLVAQDGPPSRPPEQVTAALPSPHPARPPVGSAPSAGTSQPLPAAEIETLLAEARASYAGGELG